MSAQGVRAGRAYVELGTTDKLAAGLAKAARQLDAFASGLQSISTRVAAIGLAATGGLFTAAKSFADYGDALDEASARTGLAAEDLSRLQYAAGLAGLSMSDLELAIKNLQKKGGAGGLAELRGIADQLSGISDPGERARLALEQFGKAGVSMIPLLQGGSRALDDMLKHADTLGVTMSGDAVKGAVALADTLDNLKASLGGLVRTLGQTVGPTIVKFAQWVTAAAIVVGDLVRRNADLVVSMLKGAAALVAIGTAGVVVALALKAIAAGVQLISASVNVLGKAFVKLVNVAGKSPVGIGLRVLAIGASVVGGAAILEDVFDDATASLASLEKQFADTLAKVQQGVTAGPVKLPDIGDAAVRAEIKQSNASATGGQNIERLIGGARDEKAIRKASEETAKNTEELVSILRDSRAVFV